MQNLMAKRIATKVIISLKQSPIIAQIDDLHEKIFELSNKYDASGSAAMEPFEKELEEFKKTFNQQTLAKALAADYMTHVKYQMSMVEHYFRQMQDQLEKSAKIKGSSFLGDIKFHLKEIEDMEDVYADSEDQLIRAAKEVETLEDLFHEDKRTASGLKTEMVNFLRGKVTGI